MISTLLSYMLPGVFWLSPICALLAVISVIINKDYAKKNIKKNGKFNLSVLNPFAKAIIGFNIAYVLAIVSVLMPLLVLDTFFDDLSVGVIAVFLTFVGSFSLFKISIALINAFKINMVKEEGMYLRDVPAKYSPAVLSYLLDQKLSPKRDFTAAVLNLHANGVIRFEQNSGGSITIRDLNDVEKIEALSKDERYIYDLITAKKPKNTVAKWADIVVEEYRKMHCSRGKKVRLIFVLPIIYVVCFLAYAFLGDYINDSLNLILLQCIGVSLAGWFMFFLIENVIDAFTHYNLKGDKIQDIYTLKGALEISRWKKFKHFIEDFSLVEEAAPESVILWEKYLAYAMALGITKKYKFNYLDDTNDDITATFDNIIDNNFKWIIMDDYFKWIVDE